MRDAEFQLAVAACRARIDAAPLELPLGVRWERFLAIASRHRVQALCWYALKPHAQRIPESVAGALEQEAQSIIAANLRAAVESGRLGQMLEGAGIQPIFVKGLTLGALAYRDPLLKMSMDIDLLVDPASLADTADQLRSAGYVAVLPDAADNPRIERWHSRRKESVWRHADGNLQLDLHSRLADHPAMLAGLDPFSNRQWVEVASGIALPTLGNDELFAYLCVHGASSAWFRLKWIADFAALLSGKPVAEIERLYERSQLLGAGRAAGQALLLVERIFSTGIGRDLHDRLWSEPPHRALVRIAERLMASLDEPTERKLGTLPIHWSQLALRPGIGFKASETLRQLRDTFGNETR